jgi:hypothetical protein
LAQSLVVKYWAPWNVWHSSSPWTGVVVKVVVTVVVGVVDPSLPATTSTLVIVVPPDRVTDTPVLVTCDATFASVVSGSQQLSSLYALATSVVPTHSRVMLVIWSRRITPVSAMADAISSFVKSESRLLSGHEPTPKLTSTCCMCTSFL